ncbi:MAG: hypothetical protein C0179_00525 [Fervidicoccus sp.]|nr:MAG: hypothetical protein C0179_00525 [Fervidicoccus sp.]
MLFRSFNAPLASGFLYPPSITILPFSIRLIFSLENILTFSITKFFIIMKIPLILRKTFKYKFFMEKFLSLKTFILRTSYYNGEGEENVKF